MSNKIFVGGISWNTDDESLRDAFSQYGEVVDARVIKDRETGRSRGFGFVTYSDSNSVQDAVTAMDGRELDGRTIKVNEAIDKPRGERPARF